MLWAQQILTHQDWGSAHHIFSSVLGSNFFNEYQKNSNFTGPMSKFISKQQLVLIKIAEFWGKLPTDTVIMSIK